LAVPIGVRAQTSFTVVNNGATAFRIDGVDNPTLNLTRGKTYMFNVTATGHPFYIKTVRITGSGSQYTSGVTGQAVQVGTLTFVVPMDAPNTLFYQCGIHSAMGGTLNIADPVGVPESGVPEFAWLGPAAPNPAHRGVTFRFGLPRSATIEFAVFDSRGRGVRVLTSGLLPAGEHSIRWDGRDRSGRLAPSGLYFYRLRFEGRLLSGHLVLTR
jgi:hypothetical protein